MRCFCVPPVAAAVIAFWDELREALETLPSVVDPALWCPGIGNDLVLRNAEASSVKRLLIRRLEDDLGLEGKEL